MGGMRARRAIAALLAPLAAGCVSIDHNIPSNPVSHMASDRLVLYADANGHLYPDDWDPPFKRKRVEKRHSLLGSVAFDRAMHDRLREQREHQLDKVTARLAGASRVFVLVHGFNNNQQEARAAFDEIRPRLPLTDRDAVVEFHWDGLFSESKAGQAKMWFSAVAYSQLAGTQALRGLLRRLPSQDIVIIAHSRGTSVTLSALSDPAYERRFRRKTERLLNRDGVTDFGSPPLSEGKGRIDLIFLAPAIGKPDFWKPSGRGKGCEAYRPFPRRLRSIHYAVNPGDPVLKKFFGPLASKLNATDLGWDPKVGQALDACYESFEMVPHPLDMPSHPFVDYVKHDVFKEMLDHLGRTPAS